MILKKILEGYFFLDRFKIFIKINPGFRLYQLALLTILSWKKIRKMIEFKC